MRLCIEIMGLRKYKIEDIQYGIVKEWDFESLYKIMGIK